MSVKGHEFYPKMKDLLEMCVPGLTVGDVLNEAEEKTRQHTLPKQDLAKAKSVNSNVAV